MKVPWLWLQPQEASGKADDCQCKLVADHKGEGAAFFMCSMHNAAAELLEFLKETHDEAKRHEKNAGISHERDCSYCQVIQRAERK
jgi:hypothetical protein